MMNWRTKSGVVLHGMATALPIVISGGLEAVLYQEEIEHDTANAVIAQDFIDNVPELGLTLLAERDEQESLVAELGQSMGAACLAKFGHYPERSTADESECTLEFSELYEQGSNYIGEESYLSHLNSLVFGRPGRDDGNPQFLEAIEDAQAVIADAKTRSFFQEASDGGPSRETWPITYDPVEERITNIPYTPDLIGDGTDLPPLQLALLPLKWMMIANGMAYLVRPRAAASQKGAKA